MSEFYDDMRQVATDLLTEFDQGDSDNASGAVTIIRPGTATPAANPWDEPTPGTPSTWTLHGTKRGVSSKYVDGSTVLASDEQVMFEAYDDAPRPGDVVKFNGVPLTVVKIMPVTGLKLAWTVIVRS